MKNKVIIGFLFLAFALGLSSCNKNYYAGNNKGGKGCGCPSVKK
jgi:hypothetical protein